MKEFVAEIISIEDLPLLSHCQRKGDLPLVYKYLPIESLTKVTLSSPFPFPGTVAHMNRFPSSGPCNKVALEILWLIFPLNSFQKPRITFCWNRNKVDDGRLLSVDLLWFYFLFFIYSVEPQKAFSEWCWGEKGII